MLHYARVVLRPTLPRRAPPPLALLAPLQMAEREAAAKAAAQERAREQSRMDAEIAANAESARAAKAAERQRQAAERAAQQSAILEDNKRWASPPCCAGDAVLVCACLC